MSNDPLNTLNDRISAAKKMSHDAVHSPDKPYPITSSKSTGTSLSVGMRAGTEFIGGIIGGVLFGACADWMFNIAPFGFIIGLILGISAGFYGVYRTTRSY